jgi:hypothetical protein
VVVVVEYVLAELQELVVPVAEETDLISLIPPELQELQTPAAAVVPVLRPLELSQVPPGVRV